MAIWLKSCAANPGVDWLLITDDSIELPLPPNVRRRRETLASLRRLFSSVIGFEPAVDTGYKLNDCKPLFFSLIENLPEYDYWGYCDLDVCFGHLPSLLDQISDFYDMILTEGHLHIFRNSPDVNNAYRRVFNPRRWDEILRNPVTFGMDEHWGINQVFDKKRIFSDPSLVADIDPGFRQMRLLPRYRNDRVQAFAYEDGRVFREYWRGGRYGRDEFLYAHFQKRKLPNLVGEDADSFFITPTGFLPRAAGQSDRATLARVNPWHMPTKAELRLMVRGRVRKLLGSDPLHAASGAIHITSGI